MVSMAAYDENPAELEELKNVTKELAARLSEDRWQIEQLAGLKQLRAYLEKTPLLDMLMYDVTRLDALDYLRRIRKEYRSAGLLILADKSTSPMTYMKPDIHADSLLLKPWSREQVFEVLEEFIREYLWAVQSSQELGEQFYIIDTKEGSIRIPYERICYFEAREKKIYVCAGNEEFAFYHTIDRLAEELPEQFIRCHRGFIVNKFKIRKIMLSQNIICLADGFEVPLSRSYKADVKELGR